MARRSTRGVRLKVQGLGFQVCNANRGFPKIRGTILRITNSEDYSIWESTLGSLSFGAKLPKGSLTLGAMADSCFPRVFRACSVYLRLTKPSVRGSATRSEERIGLRTPKGGFRGYRGYLGFAVWRAFPNFWV